MTATAEPPHTPAPQKTQQDQLPALRAAFGSVLVDDPKFLSCLLKLAPERATLGRLGMREADYRYREALAALIQPEPRPWARC